MWKIFCAAALVVCAAKPASCGIISTNTYAYTDMETKSIVHAFLNVTVQDNFNGDMSRWKWIYTIQNIDFDPKYMGFSDGGVKLFFPGPGLWQVQLASGFSPGWNTSVFPGCWFTGWDGIGPGESGAFSFSTPPSTIVAATGYMQALDGNYWPSFALVGDSTVPGSALPAPEPSSVIFAGLGLSAFVLLRAVRARQVRPS